MVPLLGFLAMILGWIVSVPACAIAELSDRQAIAIANKEMEKFDVDPSGWTVRLDKDRHEWQRTRESWERWVETEARGRTADTKARIEEIETVMKGKEVWLAVYNRIVPPGQRVRHSHAIVFLDVKAANILAVINPEE
jgi:hypothetical protein